LRIRTDFPRPAAEHVETIGQFTSPDVSDQLNRMYTVCPDIHCLTGGHHRLLGPVCTVKVYPGDNLMVHKSLDIAKPGDVVVVDASASPMNAVLGSLISMKARSRKIAGFIVDGYVRDLEEILPLDFPVFARGTTAVGPLHRGPGEINFPICCGGVVVSPGDVVLADQSGIAIVPRDHAGEICSALVASHKRSSDYFAAVSRGEFSNQWVDDILAGSGCSLESGEVPAGGSAAASKS
jgi:RraA family protein